FARAAGALHSHRRAAGLAQPTHQRADLVLAADEPHVLRLRAVRRQWALDDLGPQTFTEGADGYAAIAIESRLVAAELLPAPLADHVLAQRGVQLFGFAEVWTIQQGLADVRRQVG